MKKDIMKKEIIKSKIKQVHEEALAASKKLLMIILKNGTKKLEATNITNLLTAASDGFHYMMLDLTQT
jgi:hypothetical protein